MMQLNLVREIIRKVQNEMHRKFQSGEVSEFELSEMLLHLQILREFETKIQEEEKRIIFECCEE